MQQELAQITSVGLYEPLPGFLRVHLAAPALAAGMKPGQFLLASTETDYVRRPLFPIAVGNDDLSVLLPASEPQNHMIPGGELDCIGPLGKGFPLPAGAYHLLLLAQHTGFGVSEGQHCVTFLLTLIDQALAAGQSVLLVHEAPTAQELFPPAGLPPNVEVRLKTEDGSLGQAGTALDLLPELAQWADQVYAVGAAQWYGDLVRVLGDHRMHLREGLVWGLIAPDIMPCGLGVCDGCAVETGRRYQLACSDGPVFDLTQI
jgi:dihydroorotate dehydrogenase electron transfer subunit